VVKTRPILAFFGGTNELFFVPPKKPYKTIACKGGGTRQKRVPPRVPPVLPYKSTTCGAGGTKHPHLMKTISVPLYLYIKKTYFYSFINIEGVCTTTLVSP